MRPILNTARRAEIPLDVKAILEGRANDYPLMPNDMLFIPRQRSLASSLARPLAFAVPTLITGLVYSAIR
jgi:hypothetical protein